MICARACTNNISLMFCHDWVLCCTNCCLRSVHVLRMTAEELQQEFNRKMAEVALPRLIPGSARQPAVNATGNRDVDKWRPDLPE